MLVRELSTFSYMLFFVYIILSLLFLCFILMLFIVSFPYVILRFYHSITFSFCLYSIYIFSCFSSITFSHDIHCFYYSIIFSSYLSLRCRYPLFLPSITFSYMLFFVFIILSFSLMLFSVFIILSFYFYLSLYHSLILFLFCNLFTNLITSRKTLAFGWRSIPGTVRSWAI